MRYLALLSLVAIAVSAGAAQASAATASLRLVTYNVNYGNPRPGTALDALAGTDADVILLQEITGAWREALESRFAQRYPHRAYRLWGRGAGGLAVLSKHPLAAEELWAPPPGTGAWFPAQRLVVRSPLGPLQVLNVHLRPANMGGSWVRGFLETPPLRRKEIEAHWARLDRKLPTIIAGDYNEDPWGRAIDYLEQQGLSRVPTAGPTTWRYEVDDGRGRGRTELLKMDIDHVLIDGRLAARDGHVLDAGHSDHRPVVVTIEAAPPGRLAPP